MSLYLLYNDHKGWHWGLGGAPPTRPIASGNQGMNVHISELNSEVIESVVTAYDGGVEVISTEDMIARLEELNERNKNWTSGSWWENCEDDEFIICGKCLGDDGSKLCRCDTNQDIQGLDDDK